MKSPRLATMLLADLFALREKVDNTITKRVANERKHLEGKIAELTKYGARRSPAKAKPVAKRAYKKRRGKAAIKYRGPKGEKWSGRGMTPLWLRPLLKGGKKKEDFAIKPVKK